MIEQQREMITTIEAEHRTGLTRNYLALLVRRGTLAGYRPSRDWLIYTDSLDEFMKTNRRPGPKRRKMSA